MVSTSGLSGLRHLEYFSLDITIPVSEKYLAISVDLPQSRHIGQACSLPHESLTIMNTLLPERAAGMAGVIGRCRVDSDLVRESGS